MRLDELYLNWANKRDAQRPYNFDDKNYVILLVNIADTFENGHKEFTLSLDNNGGPNAIGNRLERAKKHFQDGKPMDYPEIAYNSTLNTVDYTNGRHRALAAYQLGKKYIPMFVSKDGLQKLKKLVRTREV